VTVGQKMDTVERKTNNLLKTSIDIKVKIKNSYWVFDYFKHNGKLQ